MWVKNELQGEEIISLLHDQGATETYDNPQNKTEPRIKYFQEFEDGKYTILSSAAAIVPNV